MPSLTKDGNLSSVSATSDTSSVWGGANDPSTNEMRELRKEMNRRVHMYRQEYKSISCMPELELDDYGPDVNIQRTELTNHTMKYLARGQVLLAKECGDIQKAAMVLAQTVTKCRNLIANTGFLRTKMPETPIPSEEQIVKSVMEYVQQQ